MSVNYKVLDGNNELYTSRQVTSDVLGIPCSILEYISYSFYLIIFFSFFGFNILWRRSNGIRLSNKYNHKMKSQFRLFF